MAEYRTRNITHSAEPGFSGEANLIAIIRSLRQAEAMSTAQKQILVAAAPGDAATQAHSDNKDASASIDNVAGAKVFTFTPNRDRDLAPNPNYDISSKHGRDFSPTKGAKGKPANVDLPAPGPGGKIIHHCPAKKHSAPSQCLDGGCIVVCPSCGAFISTYGGSKCLTCASRARNEANRRLREEAAAREAAAAAAAAAEREANSRKARKPKWTADQREIKEANQRAAHGRFNPGPDDHRGHGGLFPAHAVGAAPAGIKKKTGRVGSKANIIGWALPELSAEEKLTLDAAMVLYRYCEDLTWKM